MATEAIKRSPSLSSRVYEAIRDRLISGRHAPGERIVVDRLAEQLGVSPTPVREALARLLQEGLVREVAAGRLQVVPLTPRYVSDTFLVRGALEGLAAELAVPRLTDAQLTSLREALAATEAALAQGDTTVHVTTDALLHRLIGEAAGNEMLSRELGTLQVHVDFIRSYSQRHEGEHMRRAHEEHLALLEALTCRDRAGARSLMEKHIRDTSARIARLISYEPFHAAGVTADG